MEKLQQVPIQWKKSTEISNAEFENILEEFSALLLVFYIENMSPHPYSRSCRFLFNK